MSGESTHISDLGAALGEKMHVKCLIAGLTQYRAAKRGAGSRSRIWELPESTLWTFAIWTVINGMPVEEAIERLDGEFDRLGYKSTSRNVMNWVERLGGYYRAELHRVTRQYVDGLESIPADGNATSQHLRLMTAAQSKVIGALETMETINDIEPRAINALSAFVDSINKGIATCAGVPLTEAKAREIAAKLKGDLDSARSKGAPMSEEEIAKRVHELFVGGGDQDGEGGEEA